MEHPRWRLNRQMTEPLYSALDITNPEARAFLLELVDEYAELFAGSKVFHIGGDEFIDFNHFAWRGAMPLSQLLQKPICTFRSSSTCSAWSGRKSPSFHTRTWKPLARTWAITSLRKST